MLLLSFWLCKLTIFECGEHIMAGEPLPSLGATKQHYYGSARNERTGSQTIGPLHLKCYDLGYQTKSTTWLLACLYVDIPPGTCSQEIKI
jgi:hypothetical protein